ncbi:hypothetical protein DYB35_010867 [Aphanomyces astaci]|uniref:Uncharacterized protein n=1 Tax=Aphanomyces astaci TaxID=112090 RepID=A0A418CVK9_APHAT|nr:hypothetical protein DYB35_010867 [Aphanomyces astaci]
MVATRATRQVLLRDTSFRVAPRVDSTDADMENAVEHDDQYDGQDTAPDVEMVSVDEAASAANIPAVFSSLRSRPASASDRVPLPQAQVSRPIAPGRKFAPIPRASSTSRASRTPTKNSAHQPNASPNSILPDDPKNIPEPSSGDTVSEGRQRFSVDILPDDPKNIPEASRDDEAGDGRQPFSVDILPDDPKNTPEPSRVPMSEGRQHFSGDILPEIAENVLEGARGGLASKRTSADILPGSDKNSLDAFCAMDFVPGSNHFTTRREEGTQDSASGDGQTAVAGEWAGLTPETTDSIGLRASSTSSGAVPSSPSPAGPTPATNCAQPNNRKDADDVWAFQAQQRSQSAKSVKTKDVAPHRPSMEELEPLLRKRAAGTLTFRDTLSIQKHSARDIVGWMQMPTGAHTKSIDISSAMASLIFDNQALGLDNAIADIVKCEKDIPNRMLKWGVASEAAMTKLRGMSFKIQVARDGSCQRFTMSVPHVLDGFFIDIPQGLQNQDEESLMFAVMTTLEPRFLWGSYPNVSSSTGMTSSRYRLHFEGSSTPTSMQRGGRFVEELLFKGRCLRVYAQGWYYRDKNLVRLDLDAVSRQHGLHKVSPSQASPAASTAKALKRQKTAQAAAPQWTKVKAAKGKRKQPHQQVDLSSLGRSWVSPNMFDALDERVSITPEEHIAQFGDFKMSVIFPKLDVLDDTPQYSTSGHFAGGTKIHDGAPKRVEMSLDAILAELADLDSKTAVPPANLSIQVEDAVTNSTFNLARLVTEGRVDALCSHLERSPIEFGLQLHQLFDEDRACFEYFVRQRLLHRWLRATWGGDKTFAQLYSLTWGVRMTRDHVQAIFTNLELFKNIELIDSTIEGDEFSLHRGDLEEVLAVAELLMAAHAPVYYNSDAAILVSTKHPVTALASLLGPRCLSSITLSVILLDTDFGLLIWKIMEAMYAADETSRHALSTILAFHEAGSLESTFDNQVMFQVDAPVLMLGDVIGMTNVANRG